MKPKNFRFGFVGRSGTIIEQSQFIDDLRITPLGMPNLSMKVWSTPAEVACKFGISISTLKRLCDKHDIPLRRTPGGHRRIDPSHVDSVARILSIGSCSGVEAKDRVERIFDLLIEGKDSELLEFLWSCAVDARLLLAELDDTLVPALWKVGDAWMLGQLTVAQEKVASMTAMRVIDGLAARFVTRGKPSVLGATFTGSSDSIASKLIVLGFKINGITALDLGSGVAPEHVAAAVEMYDVDSIWISHTHVLDPQETISAHNELIQRLTRQCRIAIGGGGLSPSIRRALNSCNFFESVAMYIAYESEKFRLHAK